MDYEKKYNEAVLRAEEAVQKCCLDKGMFDIIFPPEESEDERIRKMCITAVNIAASADGGLLHSEASECLAWLEEQKDKNCLACDQHLKGYIVGRKVTEEEKQKEQKPIEFKNDELVEIIKGEFEGFRQLLKKKGIDYEPQRSYWEAFARLFDSSAREYIKEQKEQKPAEKQDYSELNDLERAIHRGFLCAGVENVPVTIIKETAQDCLAHIKPLELKYWDKEIIQSIISILERDNCFKVVDEKPMRIFAHEQEINYLRNLQEYLYPNPHWKPSEEQIAILWDAISNLKHDGYKHTEELISLYEELKKL